MEPSIINRGTPWPSARTIIAAVAVIFLLYFGREFFVPVAVALAFSILLRPVVRWLVRHGIRAPIGAAAVILLGLSALGVAAFGLSVPVRSWAAKVPESVAAAKEKLADLRRPVQRFNEAAAELQNAGEKPGKKTAEAPPAQPSPGPTLAGRALGTTTSLIAAGVEIVLLTWLILASDNLFYEKLLKLLPEPADKRAAAKVATDTEAAVAGYLVATALINLGQAAAVGVALWLIGMPDPVLWGALTFVLEFIPYLGGTIMIGLLAIVAFTTFDSLGAFWRCRGAISRSPPCRTT